MSGFCPDDWHGTTDADLLQMSLGEDYWLYADALGWGGFRPFGVTLSMSNAERTQKIVTDKAHALAVQRGLIPYSEATFSSLMDEVERSLTPPA